MAYARRMLETYPRDFNVDTGVIAQAIEAVYACEQACTACADACLSEHEVDPLRKCIRLDLDCADICVTTGRVLSRQTEYDAHITQRLLETCIQACTSCADECERHASMHEHCRVCAEACRNSVEACEALLSAMNAPVQPSAV